MEWGGVREKTICSETLDWSVREERESYNLIGDESLKNLLNFFFSTTTRSSKVVTLSQV